MHQDVQSMSKFIVNLNLWDWFFKATYVHHNFEFSHSRKKLMVTLIRRAVHLRTESVIFVKQTVRPAIEKLPFVWSNKFEFHFNHIWKKNVRQVLRKLISYLVSSNFLKSELRPDIDLYVLFHLKWCLIIRAQFLKQVSWNLEVLCLRFCKQRNLEKQLYLHDYIATINRVDWTAPPIYITLWYVTA